MASERPPHEPRETGAADELPAGAPEEHPATSPRAEQQPQVPSSPPRTRVSTAFSALVAGVIVLILLLIFILENTQSVKVSYFGAGGHLALGVALLLAAVGGALLVGILGVARITQVRRHAKRHARARRR
jgi:putative membrane protein